MRILSRLLLSACLLAVLAGCGASTPPIRSGGGAGSGSSGAGSGTGGGPTGAAVVTAQLTVSAATYAPGDPCASLATTTPIGNLSNDCFHEWSTIDPNLVPGQDLMSATPIPRVAVYANDTSATTATQVATAFFRAAHFRDFAELWWMNPVLKVIEPSSQFDAVAVAMSQGGFAHPIPACSYPQAIGVVTLTPDEVDAAGGKGSAPGDTAVVLHYGDCTGVPVHFADGTQAMIAPTPSGKTVVELGDVETVAPFGDIWVPAAQADCSAALARPCAVVRS